MEEQKWTTLIMAIAETHMDITLAQNNVEMATVSERNDSRQEIGRGRSAVVYRDVDADGHILACKVFDSRGLTKIVQWITLGAPNPYIWNSDAVQCAKIRRDILKLLVPVWTSGDVAVADAEAVAWNEKRRTFELQTRFVSGRAAALQHSLRDDTEDEAATLWRQILPTLRWHLEHAGFDGLLWQAGIGNPVALNNFLYERAPQNENTEDLADPDGRWVWIDLESGVPAIFPISPKVLFQYSLAHWWRLGRPLFDDVDVDCLKNYLQSNSNQLRLALGDSHYEKIILKTAHLGQHQINWKSISRLRASIEYRLVKGDIDAVQAEYYLDHQFRWILQEVGRGVRSSIRAFEHALEYIWKQVRNFEFRHVVHVGWRFLVSQKYREDFVHGNLEKGLESWTKRGQMSDRHAQLLRLQIGSPDSSVYITDFGIHIAIKPAVKLLQYLLLPTLFAMGVLGGQAVAVLILTGGAIGRSAYTAVRLVQSVAHGYERPWIALGVGILPVVGNFAYPSQMLYSICGKDENLARFMLDDGFGKLGRHFPIWGGDDTWTEHVLIRIPGKMTRWWANRRHQLADSATR